MLALVLLSAQASPLEACRAALNPPDDQACEKALKDRPRAQDEARACMEMESPAHRVECTTLVKDLRHDSVRSIDACVEAFGGTIDALRCMKSISDSSSDPFQDLEDCAQHLKDPAQKLACVKRFRSVSWRAGPAIEACSAWSDPEACLAAFVQPALFRDPEAEKLVPVIEACRTSFPKEKQQLSCVENPHGHSLVLACVGLETQDHRKECLRRGGAGKFDTGEIMRACIASVGTGVDALRCLNAVEDATSDPVEDIRACSALDDPAHRIKCAARYSDVEYAAEPGVTGCASFEDPVRCLAAIVQGGEAPSYLGLEPCRRAFPDDDEMASRCVRGSRRADAAFVARVESCASQADPEARLGCIQGP